MVIIRLGPIETSKHYSIHRPAPTFTEMGTGAQQLLTGIKVCVCGGSAMAKENCRSRNKNGDQERPNLEIYVHI